MSLQSKNVINTFTYTTDASQNHKIVGHLSFRCERAKVKRKGHNDGIKIKAKVLT